jgi:hypothetical protein
MKKTFFIVVPYGTASLSIRKGALEMAKGLIKPKKKEEKKEPSETEDFLETKMQLQQRIAVVEQGLIRCGLRIAHLGTEELIELFYKLFNPGETDKPMPMG